MPVEKLFPDFEIIDLRTSGATIHCLRKGSGPPLLLLHGYPQTHVIWHKIANRLSERYTVILTDLRGYGDSSKPKAALGTKTTRSARWHKTKWTQCGNSDTRPSSSERMTEERESLIGCASTIPRSCAKFA
jgi:pimeloyl-ACP methyl ester carboxylesterase